MNTKRTILFTTSVLQPNGFNRTKMRLNFRFLIVVLFYAQLFFVQSVRGTIPSDLYFNSNHAELDILYKNDQPIQEDYSELIQEPFTNNGVALFAPPGWDDGEGEGGTDPLGVVPVDDAIPVSILLAGVYILFLAKRKTQFRFKK